MALNSRKTSRSYMIKDVQKIVVGKFTIRKILTSSPQVPSSLQNISIVCSIGCHQQQTTIGYCRFSISLIETKNEWDCERQRCNVRELQSRPRLRAESTSDRSLDAAANAVIEFIHVASRANEPSPTHRVILKVPADVVAVLVLFWPCPCPLCPSCLVKELSVPDAVVDHVWLLIAISTHVDRTANVSDRLAHLGDLPVFCRLGLNFVCHREEPQCSMR